MARPTTLRVKVSDALLGLCLGGQQLTLAPPAAGPPSPAPSFDQSQPCGRGVRLQRVWVCPRGKSAACRPLLVPAIAARLNSTCKSAGEQAPHPHPSFMPLMAEVSAPSSSSASRMKRHPVQLQWKPCWHGLSGMQSMPMVADRRCWGEVRGGSCAK